MSNQFFVDSSEENGTIFTNDQQNEVSVTFTASGTWNTGSKIDYGPEGKVGTKNKNAAYPNNTLYALLAVNSNNEVVGEGASVSLSLEANESVRFVLNDTHYPNNRGQLTVDWQANAPDLQQTTVTYKIHPAIGIARLGNSVAEGTDGYYIAPETGGGLPIQPGTENTPIESSDLRDDQGGLKRQAARFRIYKYENGEFAGEISDYSQVTWTVRLANKKAAWYEFRTLQGEDGNHRYQPFRNPGVIVDSDRENLIIDPGAKSVSAGGMQEFNREATGSVFPPEKNLVEYPDYFGHQIDTLGSIQTDEQDRLLVLGGHGNSCSPSGTLINSYANNDNWFDDVSDGPVTATIPGATVESAWVIVASPAYAPQIPNLVTLYDTILDTAVREMEYEYKDKNGKNIWVNGNFNSDFVPNYNRDIKPILERVDRYQWVMAFPNRATSFHHFDVNDPELSDPQQANNRREFVFDKLRDPETPNNPGLGTQSMPYMAGDNALGHYRLHGREEKRFLTLTKTQYFMLEQWKKGEFESGALPVPNKANSLDRAVLENCVGGGFSPGLEMTWISRNPDLYKKESFDFRINSASVDRSLTIPTPENPNDDWANNRVQAGDITKYMALPWQADFYYCTNQPIDTHTDGSPPSGNRSNFFWWPPQRPTTVWAKRSDSDEEYTQQPWYQDISLDAPPETPTSMIDDWKALGFIVSGDLATDADKDFVEVQRTLEPASA
ncbi:MAG: LodA/GoxA family CTQ-dependent oxidase [Ardenticatenaceae bacterium]